ncbi:tetraacyldisaccharide 4'-kinase [Luminiphilus syltensis NOR5-1B]|uniref:Tetraacyldisaccharide 4'-kinase n=1 Tax=Luminiphilus syltensis NOR5-1B TaxID=565045 RepID=B8KYJ6_9GAMM|nr:tetraacyldisaccharide 4'-kinase [Luminiphilus syltensis]EED34197.1 tetraacyldisaccharide 4'-kinase [Luminiphilus syltensis NOR5-1B]
MSAISQLESFISRAWYAKAPWLWLLLPLSFIVGIVVSIRARRLQSTRHQRLPIPVIVVGGITVGGTGKTPVITALIDELQRRGYRPGVVSRGYGGTMPSVPLAVAPDSLASVVGDEPLLLSRLTGVPVAVSRDRAAAVRLVATLGADICLADDGLQHIGLPRDVEIAVLDGDRGLGNGFLLPAGPLREPAERLTSVDAVLERNGRNPERRFYYQLSGFRQLSSGVRLGANEAREQWDTESLEAITGLGQPGQFFHSLRDAGFPVDGLSLPDHRVISRAQLATINAEIVLITGKDAVKLPPAIDQRLWVAEIATVLPDRFTENLLDRMLQQNKNGRDVCSTL